MSTATLPMAPEGEPQSGGKGETRRQREAAIRAGILDSLGRPADLFRVAVVPLWGNAYRVNVLTGDDPTSVRIPHSYFVVADDRGNVLESTPAVRKQY